MGLKDGCVELNDVGIIDLRIKQKRCYFNAYMTLFGKRDFFFSLFVSHRSVPEVKCYSTRCVSI